MTTRLNGFTIGNNYELLNNAAQMDMSRFILKAKAIGQGDREIIYEKALALSKRGFNCHALLTGLKATFKGESYAKQL